MPELFFPRCIELDRTNEIDKYRIGDKYTIVIGPPGWGCVTYLITGIDDQGLWGEVLVDNSGILFEPLKS